jgi:hypothetical protein
VFALTFQNESDAKAFFIEKIIRQAERENVILSDAQRYMLAWSETDPSFVQNMELNAKFESETSSEIFENEIRGLIKRAYTKDIESDKQIKATYKTAYKVLKKGDHYLLVMINSSIGNKLSWF